MEWLYLQHRYLYVLVERWAFSDKCVFYFAEWKNREAQFFLSFLCFAYTRGFFHFYLLEMPSEFLFQVGWSIKSIGNSFNWMFLLNSFAVNRLLMLDNSRGVCIEKLKWAQRSRILEYLNITDFNIYMPYLVQLINHSCLNAKLVMNIINPLYPFLSLWTFVFQTKLIFLQGPSPDPVHSVSFSAPVLPFYCKAN